MRILAALLALASLAPTTARADLSACRELYASSVFDGSVDYARVAAHPQREACRQALTDARPPEQGAAALAFWVDAYNLLSILSIAAEPDRWSAQQDGKSIFRDRVFDVGGKKLTLDQIEHDEIARLTHDPRIEFLLSCGSRSCALLPPQVMSTIAGSPEVKGAAQPFDKAMAEGMRRWFANPDNLRVNRAAGTVEIGQLLQLDWHGADFERVGILLVKLVGDALEARDPQAAKDLRKGILRLTIRPYDWRVNRVRRTYFLP